MGTRNLTMVVVDKKIKVAQYGQWDGYPSGQGSTACNFIQTHLLDPIKLEAFKQAVRDCTEIDSQKLRDTWTKCGADPSSDFVSMAISDKHAKLYPQFSRNTGAEILEIILRGVREIDVQTEFINDSLFCEFAYLVNLDDQTLEVYKGFNKTPLTKSERFFKLDKKHVAHGGDCYYACRHWQTYAFKDATSETMAKLEREYAAEE